MNPDFSQYHTGIDWSLVDAGDWVKQNATLMHPSYKSPIQNAYMIYENANLTDEQRKNGYTGPYVPEKDSSPIDFKSYLASGGISQKKDMLSQLDDIT